MPEVMQSGTGCANRAANAKLTRPLRIQATGQKIGGVTMFYTFTLKSGAVYRVPAQYVSVMTSEA